MNRVKRISRKYDRQRDDINHLRERNRKATKANKLKRKIEDSSAAWKKMAAVAPEATKAAEEFAESFSKVEEVLMDKTVKELRVLAKEQGVKGYSRMKKVELVSALS